MAYHTDIVNTFWTEFNFFFIITLWQKLNLFFKQQQTVLVVLKEKTIKVDTIPLDSC